MRDLPPKAADENAVLDDVFAEGELAHARVFNLDLFPRLGIRDETRGGGREREKEIERES